MKLKTIRMIAELADQRDNLRSALNKSEHQVAALNNMIQKDRETIRNQSGELGKMRSAVLSSENLLDKYNQMTLRLYYLIGALVEAYNDGAGTKDRRAWMKDMITDLIAIRGATDAEKENWKLVES